MKYKRFHDEIRLNDSDYESDLNETGRRRMSKIIVSFLSSDTFINQQDPIQIYLQACKQYQIHPYHRVIEGLNLNTLDLAEMSINDLDLKAICLALRVDIDVFDSLRSCSRCKT